MVAIKQQSQVKYARYKHPSTKYKHYKGVTSEGRILRKKHKRASDAILYSQQVQNRCARISSHVSVTE